ncbi:MAG: ATP-binding protein [Desulfobacterales bacterium]
MLLKRRARGPSSQHPISSIKFPLHTKLIAAISVVMCLFMATVIFTVNQHMRQSILDEFLKRGLSVARNLAALNNGYVTTYNYVKIEQNVDFMVQENDLLYATILFFDGEPAAYSGRDEFKKEILSGKLSHTSFESHKTLVQYDEYRGISFCEIAVPIFMDNEKWGTARVGFALDTMQEAIHTTKKVLLLIGSLALFVGCLAALFLSHRITRPVNALVRSVEDLSQGDYDSAIRVTSRDEIGYLAERFAAMQTTVKENISLLTQTNVDLSLSNKKLNHEILERCKAEDALLRRDAVLTAVSFAAEKLLQEHDWKASMPEILAHLGQSAGMRYIHLERCQGVDETQDNPVLFSWRFDTPDPLGKSKSPRIKGAGEKIALLVGDQLWGHLVYELSPLLQVKGSDKTISGAMRTVAGNLGAAMERRETLVRLKSANRAKDDFLANMSHELRTPLNHIIGFTELILTRQFGELNEIQAEYLGDVRGSSKHLLSLINDILDLSKIEAGKVKFEPDKVTIRQLLESSLFMVKEKALKHQIQLSLAAGNLPEEIIADERLLKQVIYNLLGNAVKFTPEKGKITLEARQMDCYIRSGKRKDDPHRYFFVDDHPPNPDEANIQRQPCLEIAVTDSGIGIPPEKLSHIFNRFDQVDSALNRQFEGTGLGLSLAKSFIELHGGRIWAESKGENQGSKFRFVIPISKSGETAA